MPLTRQARQALRAGTTTRVYSYGFRPDIPAGGRPGDLDPALVAQLRRAHRLYNDLIAWERAADAAVDALWATVPAVARAQAAAAALREAYTAADPAERARLKPERQAAARVLSAARKAAKATDPAVVAAVKALRDDQTIARKAHVTTLRQEAATDGLYYGTYNEVIQRADAARQRVIATRTLGFPAELRHKRWDGTGILTCQIIQTADKPALTWDLAQQDRQPYRGQLVATAPPPDPSAPRGERRRQARQWGRVRLASTPDHQPIWLTGRLTLHRALPPDHAIKSIRLVRRRVADWWIYRLQFVCRVPEAPPLAVPRPGRVAVDLGWRKLPGGGLRLVTWVREGAEGPAQDPAVFGSLPALQAWSGRGSGTLALPPAWLRAMDHVDRLQSIRQTAQNALQQRLVAWLKTHALPDALSDHRLGRPPTAGDIARWHSPARLQALAYRWRDARFAGDTDMYTDLAAWAAQDRHLWREEAGRRARLLAHRDELIRVWAARIAAATGTVCVEEWDLPRSIRRRPAAQEDAPQALVDAASHQRTWATPGALRAAVVAAVGKAGGTVERVAAGWTTRVCHWCGHDNATADFVAHRVITCGGCGRAWDQDVNAARNLLAGGCPRERRRCRETRGVARSAPRRPWGVAPLDSGAGVR